MIWWMLGIIGAGLLMGIIWTYIDMFGGKDEHTRRHRDMYDSDLY
jgi:hypothetical protein